MDPTRLLLGGTLEGTVIDHEGLIVVGARFVIKPGKEHDHYSRSPSAPEGHIQLRNLLPGKHKLTATHGLLMSKAIEFEVLPGSTNTGVTLQLPKPQTVSIQVLGKGGSPLQGVKLYARYDPFGPPQLRTKQSTDELGKISVALPINVPISLRTRKPGIDDTVNAVLIAPDQETLTIRLESEEAAQIRLIDSVTQAPLSSRRAIVLATDSSGRQIPTRSIRLNPQGQFSLTPSDRTADVGMYVMCAGYKPSPLGNPTPKSPMTLALEPAEHCTGRVLMNGEPAGNVSIEICYGHVRGTQADKPQHDETPSSIIGLRSPYAFTDWNTTDDQGQFSFPIPFGSDSGITLIFNNRKGFGQTIHVPTGSPMRPMALGEVGLAPLGSIEGTVGTGGLARRKSLVIGLNATTSSYKVAVRPGGMFRFPEVPAGKHILILEEQSASKETKVLGSVQVESGSVSQWRLP